MADIYALSKKFALSQSLAELVVAGVAVLETGASVAKNEILCPWC
jgi:hypothetical protein